MIRHTTLSSPHSTQLAILDGMHRILIAKAVKHSSGNDDVYIECIAPDAIPYDTGVVTPTWSRLYAPTAAWQHRPEPIPRELLKH